MLVTKNVTDLCVLLVDELYGELPSRIFAALLSKGRSMLIQLAQHTSLTPRQIRHGLAVLLQNNLLFYHVDSDAKITYYEANIDHGYNLLRTGKILETVEASFGSPAKDVMQSLLLLGQTKISDLVAAYQGKIDQAIKASIQNGMLDSVEHEHDELNGESSSHATKKDDLPIRSLSQLNSVICRLVEAELVEIVHSKSFESYEDIYRDVERDVTQKYFPGGPRGGKGKLEFQEKMAESLRGIREQSKSLKRKLDSNGGFSSKKRKLFSGGVALINGDHENHDSDPMLDSTQVIRVNFEKCTVDLRNRRLVQFAADMYGESTAYVYGVLLRLLTRGLPRCRKDPLMDAVNTDDDYKPPDFVTTGEILDNLKTSVDLSLGVGKPPKSSISSKAAEKIRKRAVQQEIFHPEAEVDGDASADEEEDEDELDNESDYDSDYGGHGNASKTNGETKDSKVKFADPSSGKESRVDRPTQLRQHLLLLAESKQQFVRHCGAQEWTVDIEPLVQKLKEAELDTVIERTCGRHGVRLAHILRLHGKLDEKTMHNMALMRKPEVQHLMLQMEVAGFVHTQEIPRDNKHDVKRSFFLWFCDVDKSLAMLLDNTYKTMLRCIQTVEVLRQKDKDVLLLTKRTDVRGKEREVMQKVYFDRYSRFLANERKLFTQIMRLDDLVAVLRDF